MEILRNNAVYGAIMHGLSQVNDVNRLLATIIADPEIVCGHIPLTPVLQLFATRSLCTGHMHTRGNYMQYSLFTTNQLYFRLAELDHR